MQNTGLVLTLLLAVVMVICGLLPFSVAAYKQNKQTGLYNSNMHLLNNCNGN